jgi:hypothetical protein
MAVSNRIQAFYMQARLPDELAESFLQTGATGDDLAILRFAADETISSIAEEAVAHCFYWSNPRASEKFFDWVRANDDGRMWTFALLDYLWNRYQAGSAIERLAKEDPPTAEGLENLSDEQVSDLLTRTRRLKNQVR